MRLPLLACALSLASCERAQQTESLRLRVAVVGDLDPLVPVDQTTWSVMAQDWVFEPLLGIDENGALAKRLASAFQPRGGRGYLVTLRDGARFSDGSPVGVEDLALSLASMDLSVTPDGGAFLIQARQRGGTPIEVLLTRTMITKAGNKTGTALGTGPFVVAQHSSRRMVLQRWQAAPGKVATVEFISSESTTDAFARTLAGEADVLPSVPPRMVEFFDGVPHLKVLQASGPQTVVIRMNSKRLDRTERRALATALGQSDVPGVASRDGCKPVPHSASVPVALADGRQLTTVALLQDATGQHLGLALRRWLGVRGGPLQILDANPALKVLSDPGGADLFITRMLTSPQGLMSAFVGTGGSENFGGYSNAEVDAAIDEGDWGRAKAALAADPPFVSICKVQRIAVVDARFKNARVGPYGFLETLPDWEASR